MDNPSTQTQQFRCPDATETYFRGGETDAAITSDLLRAAFESLDIYYDEKKGGFVGHGYPRYYRIAVTDWHLDGKESKSNPHYKFVFVSDSKPGDDRVYACTASINYMDFQSIITDKTTGEGEVVQNRGRYDIDVEVSGEYVGKTSASDIAYDIDKAYRASLKEHLPDYAIALPKMPPSRTRGY